MIRVLEQIIAEHGAPQRIRSDNGPEFTSRAYLAWALERRIELLHIRHGKPIENAYIESFNGRLREECLNVSWFRNLFDARRQIAAWRKHYNQLRPHSSLDYRTPEEFAALHRAAGLSSAGAGKGVSNADPFPHAPIPRSIGLDQPEGTVKLSRIRPFCGRILLDQRLRINDLAVATSGENAAKLLNLTVPSSVLLGHTQVQIVTAPITGSIGGNLLGLD